MKHILYTKMVIAENLDYNTACRLMTKANQTKAAGLLTFSIRSNKDTGLWSLEATSDALAHLFVNDPMSCIIED